MKELKMSTDHDEENASLLMAATFTLTGEFYDWIHAMAQPNERMVVMKKFPRPGDLFMGAIAPWALELVAAHAPNISDKQIAEAFAKEFRSRLLDEIEKKTGIGNEVGAPGVKQGPPPTEDAVG